MGNGLKTQILSGILICGTIVFLYNTRLQLSELSDKLNSSPRKSVNPDISLKQVNGLNGNSQVVIYNRVPKTGSTSFMNVAYELLQQNSYRVVQLHVTHYKHQLTIKDQIEFSKNMSSWSSDLPTLYHGHFAYFDPTRVGVSLTPVYINMVRAPLDRLISHYYFLRYGDDVLVDKVRAKEGDTTTFDECVEQQGADCEPRKLWLQIPFFCGSAAQCWEPGSQWALDMAKTNLVTKYMVVGVTEDLVGFLQVLEQLLPAYFSGATKYLDDTGKAHIKHTRHKDPVSQKTIDRIKKTRVWKMENDFYNFALKHFNAIKAATIEQRQLGETFFKYEKVRRPK